MSERVNSLWGRLLRWMKPPRTLKINATGWYFIALVFAVGLAAVNTGNNLLYLILGAMLSFIVASGILSNMDLKDLKVRSYLPEHLFARTPALARVDIQNDKRHLPSYLLVVEMTSPNRSTALIGSVKPGMSTCGFVEVIFPRRGLYSLSGLKVSTSFPFGLFTKGMEVSHREEVLVFPRIGDVDITPYDLRGREGETALAHYGQGSDPFSVKEFMPGDNPRHIHWKSTAKRGRLMRREFAKEREHRVTLRIDPAEDIDEALREEKLELAASYASRFIMEGYAVGLACGGIAVPPDRGRDHLLFILRELALFDGTHRQESPSTLGDEDTMVIEL